MKKNICIIIVTLYSFVLSGQEKRDLLTNKGSTGFLENSLLSNSDWVKYPPYSDRKAWDRIPEKVKEVYVQKAEGLLDYSWPAIPACRYLDFVQNGNRTAMQNLHIERREAFRALVIAELLEGEGRFLNQIINGVWVYCEQTYWGLSAHLSIQKRGGGLPDINDPTIDLGVGFISGDLAWTLYFFKEEFDKVHPLISERLLQEINEKVLQPYYTRNDFWWQAFEGEFVNNWNPWCNYNVLTCILLLEGDFDKRVAGVQKVMNSLDKFINFYKDDGGCEEGPSYWGHAGGKLFDALETLYLASNGNIDIYSNELIKNMGRYISKAYIANNYYVNFADAHPSLKTRAGTIFRYGKRIGDDNLSDFGIFLANKYGLKKLIFKEKIELSLANIFALEKLQSKEVKPMLAKEFCLSETQIVGARDKEGSTEGFYFAAKGGHNNESHNHNDAGNFLLYFNGEPCLVDAGVGTYTAKTFSSERYQLWNMQSQFHNLPSINGVQQHNGSVYKAEDFKFFADLTSVFFSVDIAKTYPSEAKVEKWIRSYHLQRGKYFEIKDQYVLKENKRSTIYNFITPCEVEQVKEGRVELKGKGFLLFMDYNPSQFDFTIQAIALDDQRIENNWPQGLKRIQFKLKSQQKKSSSIFRLRLP